jgi:hypothetical protein
MRFQWQRRQMIADIESGVAITRNQIGRDHLDVRVMVVMRQVPREGFMPADMRSGDFR